MFNKYMVKCSCKQKLFIRKAKKKVGRKSRKSLNYSSKNELPDPKVWQKNLRKLRTKEDIQIK